MKKTITILSVLITFALFFTFSKVFATGGMIANAAKNTASAVGNVAGNVGNAVRNGVDTTVGAARNTTTQTTATTTNNNNNNYQARRTAADVPVTYAGMTATGWIWFIVGIFGVVVLALFLWYGNERTDSRVTDDIK